MPSTPYATLTVRVNGGAPLQGGVTVNALSTIQFGAASYDGWTKGRWEIIGPPGWAVPAGWTDDGGKAVYVGGAGPPPSFVLPNAAGWGKWMPTLVVNDGAKDGNAAHPDMTDRKTALSMLSPNLVVDVGVGESTQFDALRRWAGAMQAIARKMDAALNAAGVITWSGDLDPSSSNTSQKVRSLTGVGGFVDLITTAAIFRYAAGVVNPGRAHTRAASGAGSAMQDRTQSSAAGSSASAADFRTILGLSDGVAARPWWRLAYETVAGSTFVEFLGAQFDGTRALLQSMGSGVALRLASQTNGNVELAPHGTGNVVLSPSATGAILLSGKARWQSRTVTADLVVDTTTADVMLFVDSTAAARNITLPPATAGRMLAVFDTKGTFGTNATTLVRAGSEKIAGLSANLVLRGAWGVWILVSDGTDWYLGS